MTQLKNGQPGDVKEAALSRRDWILLPVLSLLTIIVLAGSAELIARRFLTTSNTVGEDCMTSFDPSTGPRGIANCVCWEKIFEGKPTEYRFNSSGYRDDFDFGPKRPGVYRLVMIGSSVAGGFRVAENQTFAALLPVELSRRTGRKVELYNEGMPGRNPEMIALHFDEVLAAQPDLILWILNSDDIAGNFPANPPVIPSSTMGRFRYYLTKAFAKSSLTAVMAATFNHTRTATLLRHLLYESANQYVKASLIETNDKTGFMKTEWSEDSQVRFDAFDRNAKEIEERARDAGIPVAAVLVPDRTQAAMISMMGGGPAGYDPYKLDAEVQAAVVSHGGIYIDILPDYQSIPNPHLEFYAVDLHPNADGAATIAALLTEKLTNGSVAALKAEAKPQIAYARGQ